MADYTKSITLQNDQTLTVKLLRELLADVPEDVVVWGSLNIDDADNFYYPIAAVDVEVDAIRLWLDNDG